MTSLLIGYIGTVFAYIIPLFIVYHFVYNRSGGVFSLLLLFAMTYLVGVLVCLLFYRMAVLGKSGQIADMPRSTVLKVMGTSFGAYMIVGITIFAIAFNPNLVKIFENTVGFTYIQLFGANDFANEIFRSKSFGALNENNAFNYGFLLTAFDVKNIKQFVQASSSPTTDTSKLPFDFEFNNLDKANIEKLEEYVYTKHRIGHFTWVYITSILALTISFVAMTMYN